MYWLRFPWHFPKIVAVFAICTILFVWFFIGVREAMYNILFVHGTGVRQPSYDQTYSGIKARSATSLRDVALHPCYWGGTEGCSLGSGGASIPDYDTARGVEDVDAEDIAIAKWHLLYEDPDSELDPFIGGPGTAVAFNPAVETPLETITELLEGETSETRAAEAELGLQPVWERAKRQLLSTLLAAASSNRTISPVNGEFRGALARSLVARACVLAFEPSDSAVDWPTGSRRDALVAALRTAWGGDDRGLVTDWVVTRLKRIALRIGTGKIARKRGSISDAASPATGDILLYQGRGGGIRDFIENAILRAPKPLVVLAHSLGGIACVDLLATKSFDGVVKLITVGSQAPLLYELNALWSLPYGNPLPAAFPDWLNIYDKHDFLSYIGASLFPNRVTDVLVDNGQPFPEAHSAYWSNPAVWTAIAGSLP
jgi:hypothetical protein